VAMADGNTKPMFGNSQRRQRICILGGGFGGLYTAVRLEGLMWPQGTRPIITLVDQNDRFLFKPLMYELLLRRASESEVTPTFESLLAPTSVRFWEVHCL
jgi:demethylphylloquinone reductase